MSVRDELLRLLNDQYDHELEEALTSKVLQRPDTYPGDFKSWLVPYLESSNIQTPISQIVGNFLVADTTAELGGDIHGRPGTVRVGTDPDYVPLVYDGVEQRWASQLFTVAGIFNSEPAIALPQSGTTSYSTPRLTLTDSAAETVVSPAGSWTPFPYKVMFDAGLKLQTRLYCSLACTGGETATATLRYDQMTTDSGSSSTDGTFTLTNNTTSQTFRDSGWVDNPAGVSDTADFFQVRIVLKTSNVANLASMGMGGALARWVSQ